MSRIHQNVNYGGRKSFSTFGDNISIDVLYLHTMEFTDNEGVLLDFLLLPYVLSCKTLISVSVIYMCIGRTIYIFKLYEFVKKNTDRKPILHIFRILRANAVVSKFFSFPAFLIYQTFSMVPLVETLVYLTQ